jgi:hypothetical protein
MHLVNNTLHISDFVELISEIGLRHNFRTAYPGRTLEKPGSFEHIIPVAWFDTTSEEELKACWNYLNIRVSPTDGLGGSSDLLFAKRHFEVLFEKTGFQVVYII